MSDSQEFAEDLDGDVLGEGVNDDGLPGTDGYPRDHALGVNDPNLVAADDVAMREARTTAEPTLESVETGDAAAESGDLLPPDGDDGNRDDVQQMLGDTIDPDGDAADAPAEVAAIHVDDRG